MEQKSENRVSYCVNTLLTDAEMNGLCFASWQDHTSAKFGSVLSRSLAYVTAYNEDELVGFVNLAWDGGEHAFLLDTLVHPDFRHRGIGSELVRQAIQEASLRNIKWVHVDFEPHLRGFYAGCGFRPTEAGLVRLDVDSPGLD